LNNILTGNSANNVLDGRAGNDTLTGGNGDDTYLFGKGYGNDIVVNSNGTGTDAGYDTVQFNFGLSGILLILSGTATIRLSMSG
jgi:Ca2+-binding RTX toxin-like protein